jgi:hypothetical protein
VIYSNYILLLPLFLLKKNHPKNVMSPSRRHFHRDNIEEQAELNRVDNGDHVIPMENDDINNTVDVDGTNRLIQYIYNAPMDDDVNTEEDNLQDDNDDSDEDNDDEYIFDKPILQNATESLYEGTRKSVLSVVMFLVNLKVSNGFSNTCMTQILR